MRPKTEINHCGVKTVNYTVKTSKCLKPIVAINCLIERPGVDYIKR